ncbi:MAG: DUF2846 domain-containing protein [Deltaproteobacteria bacterium]|nr:DUF2846 domain-containing protein [Deltaproteobacteria bacterium]
MKRALMVTICIALLTGCATTQMIKPEQPPELAAKPDSALLVIIRDTFLGGGIVFWNYLDGKFIGETMGKSYFITHVPPGRHYVVAATENTGIADLDFQAGRHYFLRQGIAMGVWRARTSGFFPMTAVDAEKAIKSCTYMELDSSKTFPDMEPALYQKAIEEYHAGVKENPEGYKELLEYKGE